MLISMTTKVIVLFAPCDESVTNILHLVRKSVRRHIVVVPNHHNRVFMNKDTQFTRHDLSDACHWVSEGTVAVLAVTSTRKLWHGIDSTAHTFKLPHLVVPDTCSKSCSNSPPLQPELLELAIFEYLKDQYLHDVILLHEGDGDDGNLLAYLMNTHCVRMSYLQATDGPTFFKTFERYFDNWNMADLTDEGRLLVSLGDGNIADQVLVNLIESSMHNKRTKILVSGGVHKWQERLLRVKAYEVDLVVISRESVPATDCPLAIEVLPIGYHGHGSMKCEVLSQKEQNLGRAILNGIKEDLRLGRCCSPLDEYTIWKSFPPAELGAQRLRPVAVWANDTGLLRMEPLDLEMITLRVAVVQYFPYVVYHMDNGSVILENCVLKHILKFVSKRLNFKYQLVEAPGDDWGTKIGNEWRGAIGMVMRGEADMIPYLTVTPSRYAMVEYSKPLAHVRYGLLIAFPVEPPRTFIFLRLYKKEVWLALFFTALVLSYVLCKMTVVSTRYCGPRNMKEKLRSFPRCLWLIFGILLQQGATHLPAMSSGRLLLATWWLSVLVITTTYSANLIAFLAFPETTFVVKSLEDLSVHKTVTLTIKEGCPVLEDFEQSDVEVYKRTNGTNITTWQRQSDVEVYKKLLAPQRRNPADARERGAPPLAQPVQLEAGRVLLYRARAARTEGGQPGGPARALLLSAAGDDSGTTAGRRRERLSQVQKETPAPGQG
ncbi:glutamate receptor ionotropic, delta-1 [Caerostris extrusa]|uniref:Glutamate receptor ionotropic, delta-1 n=1 Tax=Caerostris extrusa TaxID=172846 RepID=A0AAV4QLJ0_CAEEX|nr:glutamate receptor ionotropic, delta-1 [Caerostris extrusa]